MYHHKPPPATAQAPWTCCSACAACLPLLALLRSCLFSLPTQPCFQRTPCTFHALSTCTFLGVTWCYSQQHRHGCTVQNAPLGKLWACDAHTGRACTALWARVGVNQSPTVECCKTADWAAAASGQQEWSGCPALVAKLASHVRSIPLLSPPGLPAMPVGCLLPTCWVSGLEASTWRLCPCSCPVVHAAQCSACLPAVESTRASRKALPIGYTVWHRKPKYGTKARACMGRSKPPAHAFEYEHQSLWAGQVSRSG